jgi:hypothetical protein
MGRYQSGHVYEVFAACHVQYYQTELRDRQQIRVRRSHRLCAKDRVHYSGNTVVAQPKTVKPKAESKETKVAVFFVYPLASPGRTA